MCVWSLRSAGSNDYSHHALPLNSPRGRRDTAMLCGSVCRSVCVVCVCDSLISRSNTLRTFGSLTIGGPKQPTHTAAQHTHIFRGYQRLDFNHASPLEVLKNEHLMRKVSERLESRGKINMQWWRRWWGWVKEGWGGRLKNNMERVSMAIEAEGERRRQDSINWLNRGKTDQSRPTYSHLDTTFHIEQCEKTGIKVQIRWNL